MTPIASGGGCNDTAKVAS